MANMEMIKFQGEMVAALQVASLVYQYFDTDDGTGGVDGVVGIASVVVVVVAVGAVGGANRIEVLSDSQIPIFACNYKTLGTEPPKDHNEKRTTTKSYHLMAQHIEIFADSHLSRIG